MSLTEQTLMLNYLAERPQQVMVRGEGARVYDRDGTCYLDLMAGWGANVLGHCPPQLQKAVSEQLATLMLAGPLFCNDKLFAYGKALLAQTGMDRFFFVSTGAEAIETAIKLARKYGQLKLNGAYKFITFTNSFHGRTMAAMSATCKQGWEELYEPKVPGFIHLPWGDAAAVARTLEREQVAAVLLELIQGEGGINVAEPDFIKALRDLCTQHGALLMVDEVQTVGRTGKLLACEHYQLQPDVVALGKAIGGGMPLGAALAREEFAVFGSGELASTYTGHPLNMVAGLEVLKALTATPALFEHTAAMETAFRERLAVLADKDKLPITNVRGKGLMLAFDVAPGLAPEMARRALVPRHLAGRTKDSALIINAVRPNSIRLLPPLVITEADVDEFAECFAAVYREVLASPAQKAA